VSKGELAWVRGRNKGKRSIDVRALAQESPDLKDARTSTSMADIGELVRELKPRGDSDGATRQVAELRSPYHGPVAQYREQSASFDRATCARERDGSNICVKTHERSRGRGRVNCRWLRERPKPPFSARMGFSGGTPGEPNRA